MIDGVEYEGAGITAKAFAKYIPFSNVFLTIAVVLFAVSTMISWSYYGLQSWKYLFGRGKKADMMYKILFLLFVVIGASASMSSVWGFSDAMIFAMVFPNMVGLYLLFPVVKKQLNEYLREDGVFFPIDPGANAALGGMAATSASGTMAVKYGTMKTVISGLTVVLANGDIINTGTRTKKSSAGYNLTNLFIGSEGTLGIITEGQLRLSPIPESIMAAVCHFPTLENAVQTAQQVIQYGVPIARIEMLNKEQMGISIDYSNLKDVEAVPTLFFEFHGSELSNQENIKIVEEISKDNSGSSFKWAKDLEERNKLWQARWDVYYSVKALIKNGRVYSTDICVPISNITECVNFAEEQAEKFGLRAPMVGHLGDGNFHVILPYDPAKKEMYDRIREFNDLLIKKGLELNGTITGEHGVGLHKKKYLLEQHADNMPVMKSIKRTLDSNNIMNPGKIFDLN